MLRGAGLLPIGNVQTFLRPSSSVSGYRCFTSSIFDRLVNYTTPNKKIVEYTGSVIANDILHATNQMKQHGDSKILLPSTSKPAAPPTNTNLNDTHRVRNMDLSPVTLSKLLFVMSAQWDTPHMAAVVKFVTQDWSVERMVDLWAGFFKRYVDNANISLPRQSNEWTAERFGELVGRSVDNKDYVFITDLIIKLVIGHEKGHQTLFDGISKLSQPAAAGEALLEQLGQVIGKVVAMQHDWAFPDMGVALREFTTVIPKFAKAKYEWFTQEMYLEFMSNVLVSSGVYRQQERAQRTVSKNFMHNALKDVTDFWKADQIEDLLERIYRRMDDRDSYIKYWLDRFKGAKPVV